MTLGEERLTPSELVTEIRSALWDGSSTAKIGEAALDELLTRIVSLLQRLNAPDGVDWDDANRPYLGEEVRTLAVLLAPSEPHHNEQDSADSA